MRLALVAIIALALASCVTTPNDLQLKLAVMAVITKRPEAKEPMIAFLEGVAGTGNLEQQLETWTALEPDYALAIAVAANYLGAFAEEAQRERAKWLANELKRTK
jgi:hypothetical protein